MKGLSETERSRFVWVDKASRFSNSPDDMWAVGVNR
jgi:hypothetical protein